MELTGPKEIAAPVVPTIDPARVVAVFRSLLYARLDARFHCRSCVFADPMKSPAFLSAARVFRSDSTSENSLELRTMSWNQHWSSGAWSGSSWKTSGSSGWNNRGWQQARTSSDAPEA